LYTLFGAGIRFVSWGSRIFVAIMRNVWVVFIKYKAKF